MSSTRRFDTAVETYAPVTNTRRALVIALVGIAVVAALVTFTLTRPSSVPNSTYADAFTPVPKSLLVNGQMIFNWLNATQLSRVRVTPSAARQIVETEAGANPRSPVVYESLGGYINKEYIIHDWVGTSTYIPPAQPAYLIRVSGQDIGSTGPGTIHFNHYLNVIVNAEDGKVITGFSFN